MFKKIVFTVMVATLLLGTSCTLGTVRPVQGWNNGGFSSNPANPSYGTHDWIAQHALDLLPPQEKQYIIDNLAAFLYGTELPDTPNPPDGIGDTSKHHFYFWSNKSLQDDASAARAQAEYNNAFQSLGKGNLANAAKQAGIMSHYIADMTVFGHVMGNGTSWGAETHHSDYETYVEERTNSYNDEFNTYLVFDGTLSLTTAYEAARDLAYDTTFDAGEGLTCVWMDDDYNWSNPVFKNRCGESLNLAVNYLADVLHTFYVETTLHLSPSLVEYWTPAYGTTFSVDVEVVNVDELYGVEFKLCWNTTLLSLMDIDVIAPPVWSGNFFIGMNETREDLGRYWLAFAALDPSPSFNGSARIAKLTFKTTYDPIFPCNVTSSLDLIDTELSDPEANPIQHNTQDGEYRCYATKPKLTANPPMYNATTLGKEFAFSITIADIVNLRSFEFQLRYNTSLLDATGIAVGPFLHTPTSITKQIVDEAAGLIWLCAESHPSAPSANGTGPLATITFRVAVESGLWYQGYEPLECDLLLNGTVLKTNKGVAVAHDVADPLLHYEYMPIPGDLNSDGIVNIFDLRIVARAFGTVPGDPNWDSRADVNRDNRINIYDLVLICRNYGRTKP